jgi:hypothetical protein
MLVVAFYRPASFRFLSDTFSISLPNNLLDIFPKFFRYLLDIFTSFFSSPLLQLVGVLGKFSAGIDPRSPRTAGETGEHSCRSHPAPSFMQR